MSNINWYIRGIGLNISMVKPEKYRDFILKHVESLKDVMNEDIVNDLVDYLNDTDDDIDMDDIREMMPSEIISEPIAYMMYQETGIQFDSPKMTEWGEECVLFTTRDPWKYNAVERNLTYERLREIIKKYADELGITIGTYRLDYYE